MAPPTADRVLWYGDYESGDLSQWVGPLGKPAAQRAEEGRIRVVKSPRAEGVFAARFEVRPGDRWKGSARAEVLHDSPSVSVSEGDSRIYQWYTMWDADYPSDDAGWQIATQWHPGIEGAQPTLQVYAQGDRIGFKTAEPGGDSSASIAHWTTDIRRGEWHHFALQVAWSADPNKGSVTLWHNQKRVVDTTSLRTLGREGRTYLKQGLYRSPELDEAGVVFHDGFTVSATGEGD